MFFGHVIFVLQVTSLVCWTVEFWSRKKLHCVAEERLFNEKPKKKNTQFSETLSPASNNLLGRRRFFFLLFHLSIKRRISSASNAWVNREEERKHNNNFLLPNKYFEFLPSQQVRSFGKRLTMLKMTVSGGWKTDSRKKKLDKWKSWSAWGLHCQSIKRRFIFDFVWYLHNSTEQNTCTTHTQMQTERKLNPLHEEKCSSVFLKLE